MYFGKYLIFDIKADLVGAYFCMYKNKINFVTSVITVWTIFLLGKYFISFIFLDYKPSIIMLLYLSPKGRSSFIASLERLVNLTHKIFVFRFTMQRIYIWGNVWFILNWLDYFHTKTLRECWVHRAFYILRIRWIILY